MPRHALKLLALSAALAVAPANAGHRIGPATDNHSSQPACPYERARLAAALAASQAEHATKVPTRITLLRTGVPKDRSQPGIARGSLLSP
jgi:hypothetical protein